MRITIGGLYLLYFLASQADRLTIMLVAENQSIFQSSSFHVAFRSCITIFFKWLNLLRLNWTFRTMYNRWDLSLMRKVQLGKYWITSIIKCDYKVRFLLRAIPKVDFWRCLEWECHHWALPVASQSFCLDMEVSVGMLNNQRIFLWFLWLLLPSN